MVDLIGDGPRDRRRDADTASIERTDDDDAAAVIDCSSGEPSAQ
ncbi:hypothetical protein [Couchioplanes caeruleus]|nr:hypothetical protein [Couchioplanes caeruleus]